MTSQARVALLFIGIILLAFALGYFIYNQRFDNKKVSALPSVKTIQSVSPSPVMTFSPSPTPTSSSDPAMLGEATTKGGKPLPKTGVSSLPATGAPLGLIAVFSTSALIAGWSLRKFPE